MNSRNRKGSSNSAVGQEIPQPLTVEEAQRLEAKFRERTKQQIGASVAVLAGLIVQTFEQLQSLVYAANEAQGFWDNPRSNAELIALMHSELSEALEADRKEIAHDDHIPDFTGLEAEFADTVIRLLDASGGRNLRLGEAIVAKLLYNLSRPAKHGKKY